ncbi:SERTA domain-containing protein 2-like [Chanos chanos]|uniref:SERTA domain-containing protein 2-like n=1 Tax=Chanos chanos TaxID=29144 RepID=A0A6J2WHS1_CHACN|nr:SERTA domain-containing protein 2-like [Chanos chanos]
MSSCGVKRKREFFEEEEDVRGVNNGAWNCDVSYLAERQLVFRLCLDKMQGGQIRSEPSLYRSVLVANTLKQIQEEIKQERATLPKNHTAAPPNYVATPWHTPNFQQHHVSSAVHYSAQLCDGDSEDKTLTTSSHAGEDEVNLSLFPSAFYTSSSSSCSSEDPLSGDTKALNLSSFIRSFEFSLQDPPSYISDLALDDVFEDIDTSMYDSSDISSILPFCPVCSGVQSSRGDEDLKLSPSHSSSRPLQLSLSDVNDLDQVMELLVGS